jgi:hypothetical protein
MLETRVCIIICSSCCKTLNKICTIICFILCKCEVVYRRSSVALCEWGFDGARN